VRSALTWSIGAHKTLIEGNPDPKHVSTSLPSGKISMFGCTLAGLLG
jgi:hypothetical protein